MDVKLEAGSKGNRLRMRQHKVVRKIFQGQRREAAKHWQWSFINVYSCLV
jgi:hypothetical protein